MERDETARVIAASGAAFAAIRENQETLRKLSAQFKPIQEAIRASGVAEAAARSLKAFESDRMRAAISAASLQQERFAAALEAAGGARSVAKMLESQKGLLDSLTRMQSPALAQALKNLSAIGASSLALSLATSDSLSVLSKIGIGKSAMARMLEPVAYQTKLISSAKRHLARALDPAVSNAYKSALDISSRSLLDATDELAQFAVAPVVNDGLLVPRPYNVGQAIVRDQSILIAEYPGLEFDPRTFSELLLGKVHSVLRLIAECNQAAQVTGKQEVFKPTTQIMMAFADAPMIIATNKNRLADLVDCLYFMLYEGAGKDNLRYLTSQGGHLESDECEAVWAIKVLRNKWLRHDPDHGDQAKIRKSWVDLRDYLQWLGVCGIPHQRHEFMRLQMGLLSKVEEMLVKLLTRLKSENMN